MDTTSQTNLVLRAHLLAGGDLEAVRPDALDSAIKCLGEMENISILPTGDTCEQTNDVLHSAGLLKKLPHGFMLSVLGIAKAQELENARLEAEDDLEQFMMGNH